MPFLTKALADVALEMTLYGGRNSVGNKEKNMNDKLMWVGVHFLRPDLLNVRNILHTQCANFLTMSDV